MPKPPSHRTEDGGIDYASLVEDMTAVVKRAREIPNTEIKDMLADAHLKIGAYGNTREKEIPATTHSFTIVEGSGISHVIRFLVIDAETTPARSVES